MLLHGPSACDFSLYLRRCERLLVPLGILRCLECKLSSCLLAECRGLTLSRRKRPAKIRAHALFVAVTLCWMIFCQVVRQGHELTGFLRPRSETVVLQSLPVAVGLRLALCLRTVARWDNWGGLLDLLSHTALLKSDLS